MKTNQRTGEILKRFREAAVKSNLSITCIHQVLLCGFLPPGKSISEQTLRRYLNPSHDGPCDSEIILAMDEWVKSQSVKPRNKNEQTT